MEKNNKNSFLDSFKPEIFSSLDFISKKELLVKLLEKYLLDNDFQSLMLYINNFKNDEEFTNRMLFIKIFEELEFSNLSKREIKQRISLIQSFID